MTASHPDASILRLLCAGDARVPPLILVHPSGGYSDVYAALAGHLRWGGGALGIDSWMPPPDVGVDQALGNMARAYVDLLEERAPMQSYYLAGWTIGGVIAVQMGVELMRRGRLVSFVGLFDSGAPVPALREKKSDRETLTHAYASVIGWMAGRDLAEPLSEATPAEVVRVLGASGALPTGWDDAIVADRLERFVTIVRAFLRHEQPRVTFPLHLFLAGEQHPSYPMPKTRGWEGYAGVVHQISAPGTHYTMLSERNAEGLASLLDEQLASVAELERKSR